VVGDDETGKILLQKFRSAHIPVTGIQKIKGYVTVTKSRTLAGYPHSGRQQVVRVDREPDAAPDRHSQRELVMAMKKYARIADALLVYSDAPPGAAAHYPRRWLRVRLRRAARHRPGREQQRNLWLSGLSADTSRRRC